MNYKKTDNVGGTFLQGYITIPYNSICNKLGEPSKADEYKSDCEWAVEFDNGTVATLYNWKNGINYLGREYGIPKEEITNWNIGGNTKDAVTQLENILKGEN